MRGRCGRASGSTAAEAALPGDRVAVDAQAAAVASALGVRPPQISSRSGQARPPDAAGPREPARCSTRLEASSAWRGRPRTVRSSHAARAWPRWPASRANAPAPASPDSLRCRRSSSRSTRPHLAAGRRATGGVGHRDRVRLDAHPQPPACRRCAGSGSGARPDETGLQAHRQQDAVRRSGWERGRSRCRGRRAARDSRTCSRASLSHARGAGPRPSWPLSGRRAGGAASGSPTRSQSGMPSSRLVRSSAAPGPPRPAARGWR